MLFRSGKYPFFLKEALRMINKNGIIFADNILYKGYVMSDYNKHKQRTAVRNLREYIKEVSESPNLETERHRNNRCLFEILTMLILKQS